MHETVNVVNVTRAMHILEMLDGARRGMNISEIGRRLGIPKSTAHLIVLTLENLGYLTKSNRNLYELSLKAYALGRERMEEMGLPNHALPAMTRLAAATSLTTHLSVLEKHQGVIVQKVNGMSSRFDTFIGKRISLHCTATGKVLLAHATAYVQKQVLGKTVFMRHTRNTIASAAQLQQALATIRQTGYAIDDEEEELGARCLAMPILGAASECVAALSISGTLDEIQLDNVDGLVRLLQRAAGEIRTAILNDRAVVAS
jgi:DNA-binding IclR family transcriptional regulator